MIQNTEHNTQITNHRERIIDLLKGICILTVCFTHYAWKSHERSRLLFSWWVDMAVPVFMILSGYVYEKTVNRRNINSLSQLYAHYDIIRKSLRFSVPVLITYILTLLWDFKKYGEIPYDILITFLRGGIGQGAYYYPVIMQTIFVLPVIAIVIKRHEEKGLMVCLAVNIIYEILHVAYHIPVESYRLLMFRYIFVLSAGCYIALGKKVPLAMPIAMLCCGALFLYAYLYTGYQPIYVIHWTGTSFFAGLYIVPVVWLVIRKCKLHFVPIEFLGKASYHIFVMQMFYYYAIAPFVYQYVQSRKAQLLICMAGCLCLGVLLYSVEVPVTKYLQNKLLKSKK